jgi:ubiquinone/menaquinone biosynthesis C-methylase UbiE
MWKPLWNILYLLGRTRWDTGVTPPELVELIETSQVPPGRALDIGCGTGTNAIYLAQHCFQTTGIDISSLAIRRAQYKAQQAGMPVKFYAGNALRLGLPRGLVLANPFDFVLDIGCFHSQSIQNRQSYVDMLLRVIRKGGFYLLYALGPRKGKGLPVGLIPEEVMSSMGSCFHDIWVRHGDERGAPSSWYFFQRQR